MCHKNDKLKNKSGRAGFTLIEVVLVILALGLLFLPVLHYFFGMSKSATDSWNAVKAAEAGQTLLAEIKSAPSNTVIDWNGRTDQVGPWKRTVQVDYVNRDGDALYVSITKTQLMRVKVTLQRAGSNDISFTTIVEYHFPLM